MNTKIIIQGMHFKAHHGYYLEEQKIGGQYSIDVEIDYDFLQAAETDSLDNTINYEILYELCKSEMAINRKLIESVGLSIARKIKSQFSEITRLVVIIHKINPPIDGLVDKASVRIELN